MRVVLWIWFVVCVQISSFSQQRLEKESKYLIQDASTEKLIHVLDSLFSERASRSSTEQFYDEYFDSEDDQLLRQKLSLRYRERIQSQNQEKKLVQFKGLISQDSHLQFEYKFDVPNQASRTDIYSRHPLLGHVEEEERERLAYELTRYEIDADKLKSSLSLSQQRQRWYLSDDRGDLITISVDDVSLSRIPFHQFTELEIEINENRYTNAGIDERIYLDEKQNELLTLIQSQFPTMVNDQRSKYEKMRSLIDASTASWLASKFVWALYGFIVMLAGFKLFRL